MSESEPASSVLGRLLAQFHVSALLGLEYVVEVKIRDNEEVFKCLLCGKSVGSFSSCSDTAVTHGSSLKRIKRKLSLKGATHSRVAGPDSGY